MARSPHAHPQSRIAPGVAKVGDLICGLDCDDDPVTLAVRITNNKDWQRVALVPSFVEENEYWLGLRKEELQAVVFDYATTTWFFHDAG